MTYIIYLSLALRLVIYFAVSWIWVVHDQDFPFIWFRDNGCYLTMVGIAVLSYTNRTDRWCVDGNKPCVLGLCLNALVV